jgi:hypothetical protein
VPQRLIDDLQALGTAGDVPHRLDAAILAAATAHFVRQRRRTLILRLTPIAAAAAAVFVLAVVWPALTRSHSNPGQSAESDALVSAPTASPDVTPNGAVAEASEPAHAGRITILNAFALARHLKAGDPLQPEWDANRDGVVDRRDVDTLAMAAVRLEGGS